MAVTQYPSATSAARLGYQPLPAEDDDSAYLKRVMSARKYMAFQNEVLALGKASYVPIYNNTGSEIKAGPVRVSGFFLGTGYLVNGAAAQADESFAIDTGTAPIAIGDTFTVAGAFQNPANDLMIFTATSALTGAGTLAFTPPLPNAVSDNAIITVNQGFLVSTVGDLEADLLVLADMDDKTWAIGVRAGLFDSQVDTSGAAVGDPVYLNSGGSSGLSLTPPAAATKPVVVAGYVVTLANPGAVFGIIKGPTTIGGSQIGAGAILNANVGAAAAIAGTKIAPDFGAQDVNVSTGQVYKVNAVKVVAGRETGWTVGTHTAVKADLDESTATASDCAKAINALVYALANTHGIIGA